MDDSTGINCEIDVDDCKSNPCDYGTCIDKINGFECTCKPGYTGKKTFPVFEKRNCGLVSIIKTVSQE